MLTGAVRPAEAVAAGDFAVFRGLADEDATALGRAVGAGVSGGAGASSFSGDGDSEGSGLSDGDSSGLTLGEGSGVSSGVAAAAGLGRGDLAGLALRDALDRGAGAEERFLVVDVLFFFFGAGVGVGVLVNQCFTLLNTPSFDCARISPFTANANTSAMAILKIVFT
jgi:hypothetical protein